MTPLDRLFRWVGWWMPSRLVYWCGVRIFAFATTGKYRTVIASQLSFTEAMERWEEGHEQ